MVLSRDAITQIAKEAADKALEGQSSCVSAGIQLYRERDSFNKATPIIYPVNVKGLVREEDLKVPHSELALHVGAAGKELLAFALTGTSTGVIVYNDGESECKYLFGREDEVMSGALREKVSQTWEKRGPGLSEGNPDKTEVTEYPYHGVAYGFEGKVLETDDFQYLPSLDSLRQWAIAIAKGIYGEQGGYGPGLKMPIDNIVITGPRGGSEKWSRWDLFR